MQKGVCCLQASIHQKKQETGLSPGRFKKRFQGRFWQVIIFQNGIINEHMTIILLFNGNHFSERNKRVVERVNIDCFIGQFTVAVIIIIVDIIAPIVHA